MAILSVKNGTSSIPGATVKGDFNYFSGGTRALGPTSVTGFRSGYDAPNGGYTVYQAYGVGRFSATVAIGNTELNNVLIQMGGTGTTVQQNITWATNTANVFINAGVPLPVYTFNLGSCCFGTPECNDKTVYTNSPSIIVGTTFFTDNGLTIPFVPCFGGGQPLIQGCTSTLVYDAFQVNNSGVVTSINEFLDCA
jgi:hypothetical protein